MLPIPSGGSRHDATRQRLFGRKSEQTTDPATPQLALFNEAERVVEPIDEATEKEAVAPTQQRGKRKPLPADRPRIEVIHELSAKANGEEPYAWLPLASSIEG